MIDLYTKIVGTVIAAALCALAAQHAFVGQAKALGDCGSLRAPCFIINSTPLDVNIRTNPVPVLVIGR